MVTKKSAKFLADVPGSVRRVRAVLSGAFAQAGRHQSRCNRDNRASKHGARHQPDALVIADGLQVATLAAAISLIFIRISLDSVVATDFTLWIFPALS